MITIIRIQVHRRFEHLISGAAESWDFSFFCGQNATHHLALGFDYCADKNDDIPNASYAPAKSEYIAWGSATALVEGRSAASEI
jgi:hypothetical protein